MNRKRKSPKKKYLLCLYVDYIINRNNQQKFKLLTWRGEIKEIIFVPPQHPPSPPSTHSLTHPNNILSNMLKLEQLFIDDDT